MSRIAIESKHIIQPDGSELEGFIVVDNGKIDTISSDKPKGVDETINAKNLYVSPGLIDAHTHLGMYEEASSWAGEDGNEMIDPITPHVRAIDSINPEDKAFKEARQAGVTSVMITPGSGNVMGGQICVVKNIGKTLEEMLVSPHVGIKMAMGENPKRVYGKQGKAPMTRMGVAAMLRDTFTKARHYLEKKEKAASDPEKDVPEINLKYEALIPVLKRHVPARIHAHRHDDILTAWRVCQEFDLRMVSEHCTEGYKIGEILAENNIAANAGPTWTYRSKIELKDLVRDNAYQLYKAGVKVSIITDHPVVLIEDLPTEMQKLGKRFEIPYPDLLAMVTTNPASTLTVGHRLGALQQGYDADIVCWNHHPCDPRAVAETTLINGQVVYQR